MTVLTDGITDVIPAEIHGFTVEVTVGPYPADAGHTHRRAVYAALTPATSETQRKMHLAGKGLIVSTVPLADGADRRMQTDEKLREQLAMTAVREASRLARLVKDS